MKTTRSPIVLLFKSSLFELSNDMMNGVYDYARQHGWQMQLIEHGAAFMDTWENAPQKSPADVVRQSLAFWHPVGCLVELGTGSVAYLPQMFDGLPTVFLDISPRDIGADRLCVYSDSEAVVRCAAKELLSFGWRNAAVVPSVHRRRTWSVEREQMFVSVMRENGLRLSTFSCPPHSDSDEQSYLDALREWLSNLPLPCALFAVNDLIGRKVLSMAKNAGIDVPRELAVVAVDDDVKICEHTVPTLSSVRQDMRLAGTLAAKLLDERLTHPRRRLESVRFGPVGLVRRASSSHVDCCDRRVLAALEYIRVHAVEGITSADVAAQFDCSRRFLDRVFARVTGRTLLAEIQRVQVEAVRQVLRQSPAMKQYALADACGFASPEDLRRVFKKVSGQTIGAWLKARTQDVTVGLF